MRKIIYIGADSAGYELKNKFKDALTKEGYEVHDCGTNSTASCHYPVFASEVSKNVVNANGAAYGILICGTGIGMSMCANKYNGIRAAVCLLKSFLIQADCSINHLISRTSFSQ